MMNQKLYMPKLSKYFFPLVIFFLVVIVLALWFRRGLLFAGGEESLLLYNPEALYKLSSQTWYTPNAGSLQMAFLQRVPYAIFVKFLSVLRLSPVYFQFITFLILMSVGTISVFYLINELLGSGIKKNSANVIAFISALFYLFNPYSMTQVWGRGLYAQFFAFALVPLFLFFYIKGLENKNIGYGILSIFAGFIFSAAYVIVSNVIVLWTSVLIFLIFFIWGHWKSKGLVIFSIIYSIFVFVFWMLVNFWWIYPMLASSQSSYLQHFNSDINLGTLMGISREYLKPNYVIRLIQGFIFFVVRPFNGMYSTMPFQFISWWVPLVSVFFLGGIKRVKYFYFILTLFLFGYFVSVGANPPFGKIFVWFFQKYYFLQAFRNPFEKAGLLLMLAYSFIFALGLFFLSGLFSRRFEANKQWVLRTIFVSVIITGSCIVYVWPFWNGDFTSSWVGVPSFYNDANKWLNSQPGDYKLLHLPISTGDGERLMWDHPYQGVEPSPYLFDRTSVASNSISNKVYYNILLQRFGVKLGNAFGPDPDITKSDFRSSYLWQELAKLDVRYIVFHNDWDEQFMGLKVKQFVDYLETQPNIRLVKTFGKLDIYEVKIPHNIYEAYSPDVSSKLIKVSSTFYKLDVFGAEAPVRVYLLQTFDPGWAAYVDNKKVDDHSVVFSYANQWVVDRRGDFEVFIKYTPQDYVDFGWKVTGATLLFLSIASFIIIRRERN